LIVLALLKKKPISSRWPVDDRLESPRRSLVEDEAHSVRSHVNGCTGLATADTPGPDRIQPVCASDAAPPQAQAPAELALARHFPAVEAAEPSGAASEATRNRKPKRRSRARPCRV